MTERMKQHAPLLIGLLFFTGMTYAGYATMIKKNIGSVKEPVYLPVLLETAESLKVGSTVTVLGVPKGILGSLHYILIDEKGKPVIIRRKKRLILPEKELDAIQGQFVFAVLDLTEPVDFYSNYDIVTQYPALFSAKTVDIRPGKKTEDSSKISPFYLSRKEVAAFRTGREGPSIAKDDLLHAHNFGDPLFLITEIIGENRKDIRRITRNMAVITGKMSRGDGTVAAVLNKKELDEGSKKTLKAAAGLLTEVGDGLESFRETNSMIDFAKTFLTILLAAL